MVSDGLVFKDEDGQVIFNQYQLAWQADEKTILSWTETEGYLVDGTVGPNGQYSKADIPEHTQYDTESLAKFAFSMFWQAMCFAEKQQVPILMDF